jgi:hypothetical protein
MTTVNVSSVTNTVTVTENGSSTVVTVPVTSTVTAITQGPQGPVGPSGLVVDDAAKVDQSVVYYDAAAAMFKADAIWTVPTIADGGNF